MRYSNWSFKVLSSSCTNGVDAMSYHVLLDLSIVVVLLSSASPAPPASLACPASPAFLALPASPASQRLFLTLSTALQHNKPLNVD